jgi:hypothetical protein
MPPAAPARQAAKLPPAARRRQAPHIHGAAARRYNGCSISERRPMSVHPLSSAREIDPLKEAKIHLAAAHRLAVFHDLEQGIDNHFTVTVPGSDDRYLILPFGLHWSEARASDMIVWDESGKTLVG